MIIHHTTEVQFTYHGTGDRLDKLINDIITIEAQAGFNCVGLQPIGRLETIHSRWLLLFEQKS